MIDYDENGWASGAVAPIDPRDAWSLLSPDAQARMDVARWDHQARRFFGARLDLARPKRYPTGAFPLADAIEIDVAPLAEGEAATRVLVVTVPIDRAPAVRAAAEAGVRAIGGAGFDALLARARRVWQASCRVDADGDGRAPLVAAAVLASLLLAPVVPPEGGAIFGVKGARVRLEAAGWRGV